MTQRSGFTLIELSIVLVIIGLLAGSVLVGQDLIKAATIRAQITQIEKYNTAVNTFRGKYNCLPGDCPTQQALSFGFFNRTGNAGDGDGNGYIDDTGWTADGNIDERLGGENVLFWTDLSAAQLIDGNLTADSGDIYVPNESVVASYLPPAKISDGDFITVYGHDGSGNEQNTFEIINIPHSGGTFIQGNGLVYLQPAVTPIQAYSMDSKVDDGLPLSGKVQAMVSTPLSQGSTGVSISTLLGSPFTQTSASYAVQGGPPWTYATSPTSTNTIGLCLSFQAQF